MNNMKKLLALMLALTMVLAMTACGSEPKGSVTPNSSSSEPSAAPEATPEPTAEPEDDFELGTTSGGTYTNDFVGIGCKLDEGWEYLSEEDVLAMNGLVADSMDDEELAEQLRNSDTFYDMVAIAEDGMSNVNVIIMNLGLLYGTVLSTSDCVDATMDSLEDQLAAAGMDVTKCEKISFDFCGKSADGIYVASTMNVQGVDVEVYQRQVYVKAGTYICCVTASTYFEDTTADLLNLFYSV